MSYWACVRHACDYTTRTGNTAYVVLFDNGRTIVATNEDIIAHLVRNMGARVLLGTGGHR